MSRIDCVTETSVDLRLARDGGKPARTRPEHPMFPGGMEIGEEEVEAAARVLRSHNVFRYYGVGEGPHEVADFEREFADIRLAARALRECGLVGADLRVDRRRGRAGRRGDHPRVHLERHRERRGRDPRCAGAGGGRRLADPRRRGRRAEADLPDEGGAAGAHARGARRHGRPAGPRFCARAGRSRTSARPLARRTTASGSAPLETRAPSASSSTRS